MTDVGENTNVGENGIPTLSHTLVSIHEFSALQWPAFDSEPCWTEASQVDSCGQACRALFRNTLIWDDMGRSLNIWQLGDGGDDGDGGGGRGGDGGGRSGADGNVTVMVTVMAMKKKKNQKKNQKKTTTMTRRRSLNLVNLLNYMSAWCLDVQEPSVT